MASTTSGSSHRRVSSTRATGDSPTSRIKFPLGVLTEGGFRTGRSISLPSLPALATMPPDEGMVKRIPLAKDEDSDVESYRCHLPDNFSDLRSKFLQAKHAVLPDLLLPVQRQTIAEFNRPGSEPDMEVMSYLLTLQAVIKRTGGLIYLRLHDDQLVPTLPDFLVFSVTRGAAPAKCEVRGYRYCRHAYFSILTSNPEDSFLRVLGTNEEKVVSIATKADFHVTGSELERLFTNGRVTQALPTGPFERLITLFTLPDLLLLNINSTT